MKLFNLIVVFLCVAFFSASVSAAAFIKFDGVDGESLDSEHKDWIDVLSIDWGMHKPTTTGQSRRRGSVIVEDIRLRTQFSLASPQLMQTLANGRILRTAEIEFVTTGRDENPLTYIKYTLTNVQITGYKTSAEGDDVPIDEISFNFEEIEVDYVSPGTERESMFRYSTRQGR